MRTPAFAAALAVLAVATTPVAAKGEKTLGFVITTWNTALYESKFLDECPNGFNVGYDEIWWRSLSKEDRGKFTDNGLTTRLDRYFRAIHRGPHGEDVCMNPSVVKDPPMRLIEGKLSYGANLDGTTDGHATPKTCKHEKFTGVDGTPAVDNQMYRLLGCIYGFHSYGQYEVNANENRKSNGNGMTLIEIAGIDDPRNSPNVTVTFYRSIDQYTLDGGGKFTPFGSYRIDTAEGKPRYGKSVKGKIVNGVLTTEPGDVDVPFYGNYTYMDQDIKDLRLTMEMAADGASAKGTAAGYYGVDQLIFYIGGIGPIQSTGMSDCPAIYAAAHEIADGYPDKDGHCTSLSSAYNFNAVAAYIIHPEKDVAAAASTKPTMLARVISALTRAARGGT